MLPYWKTVSCDTPACTAAVGRQRCQSVQQSPLQVDSSDMLTPDMEQPSTMTHRCAEWLTTRLSNPASGLWQSFEGNGYIASPLYTD